MNFQIRQFERKDVVSVSKLYLSAYAGNVWHEKWHLEDAHNKISEIALSPDAVALVCIDDNEIIGCILSSLMSWHTGKQLEVKELFVNPKYQNHGIGCMLMKKIEEMLPGLGVSEMFLWTKSETKLVEFYKKCGYVIVEDTIQMIKKI